MNRIAITLMALLLFSCNSNQINREDTIQKVEVKEVDLLEAFKIDELDSLKFIRSWNIFINNLSTSKSRSFDTVECWSAEDSQRRASDYLLIDSCIVQYLLPLQKASIWSTLKTNDFDAEIHIRQSDSIGRYCISFPRNKNAQSTDHVFKHYFYFNKIDNKFLFQGYVYN